MLMKIITEKKAFQSNDNFPLADSPYFGMRGGGQGQGPIQEPPPPACEQNDWQTRPKSLPSRNR